MPSQTARNPNVAEMSAIAFESLPLMMTDARPPFTIN